MTETINIGMNWKGSMQILITCLESGTEQGKAEARAELTELAEKLDKLNDQERHSIDTVWHVSRLSEWLGAICSSSRELFVWDHKDVKPAEDGSVPFAVTLDTEAQSLTVHVDVSNDGMLYSALIGYCKSNDLEFIEVI